MNVLMRNIGMTLFTIQKVNSLGVDTQNLLVNMDWQHLIMNGENLAEYADLLASENKLGHQHGNDGWGSFDDDNVVGFFSSRRRHTRYWRDWSSDVCSSDLKNVTKLEGDQARGD